MKNDEMPDGRIGCGTRQSENDDRQKDKLAGRNASLLIGEWQKIYEKM